MFKLINGVLKNMAIKTADCEMPRFMIAILICIMIAHSVGIWSDFDCGRISSAIFGIVICIVPITLIAIFMCHRASYKNGGTSNNG